MTDRLFHRAAYALGIRLYDKLNSHLQFTFVQFHFEFHTVLRIILSSIKHQSLAIKA